jgi:hypothetical protein
MTETDIFRILGTPVQITVVCNFRILVQVGEFVVLDADNTVRFPDARVRVGGESQLINSPGIGRNPAVSSHLCA